MYYRNNKVSFNNKTDNIKCQILDWKTSKELELDEEPSEESESSEPLSYDIHLFGITDKKESIHIKVTNFKPYFYVEIPTDWSTSDINKFVCKLKENLRYIGKNKEADSLDGHKISRKYKLYGFTNKTLFTFVKLSFLNKEGFNAYKNLFYKKIKIHGLINTPRKFEIYESNIEPFLRFMHMKNLDSCGWIQIPANKYKLNEKETTCQIDIKCKYNVIEKYETKQSAKIIQAAFDIECTSCDGDFPQANRPNDNIIQIGTTVREYGETGFLLKHIITLGSCSPIEGAIVESYDTEKEVLLAWTKLIQRLDPDILYGYNIFGFDFKYMYDRAKLLDCHYKFSQLSKVKDLECKLQTKRLSSSALGDNIMYLPFLPGRISIDIMKIVQRDHKLTSYKLDNVAKEFIQDEKDDVTPAQIFAFQKGTADDRRTIAKYCIQDCALLNDLSDKLNILTHNLGMANVCSVPLEYIIMRGQGIKVFSLVAKFCREHNYLIPVMGDLFGKWCEEQGYKRIFINKETDDKYEIAEKMDEIEKRKTAYNETCKYEGATVFEPQIGFHKYVVVKDFKSLYPSEMIASNLSHDTYVKEGSKYDNLPGVDYKNMTYQNPITGEVITDRWAQIKYDESKPNNEQARGIIPLILIKLLAERTKFKKLMAKETDPFQKSVLDGVQLALKVTCNSVYGQCGASTSSIYFKPVAASTTAGGRAQLEHAKEFVEKNHPGAECVYGDTDSIFVDFKVDETNKTEKEVLQESIDLGVEYGERITEAIGIYPHELEYEKTFCPLILMSKKRYVGKLYEFDVNKFKRKSMGDASKRRDYAPIVKTIYNGMVDILLNDLDEEKAVSFILKETEKLLNGEQPKDDFLISKTLRSKYKNRKSIGHAVLADRMKERDPGNAPQVNDRVPFVYVECFDKAKKVGDNMENPEYAEQNGIKIDYLYYLERQIMNPVCQILDILVTNSKELFSDAIKQELINRKDKIAKCNRTLKNNKNNQSEISNFFGTPYQPKVKDDVPISIIIPSDIKLKNKIENEITTDMSSEMKETITMYNWLTSSKL